MAGVLQHLRSSTLNKRPNPASMVDGQLAINYASGSPGAFFKDSNGNLVKVGPVHVGATAPNVSPASGGTAGNSLGEQWLDTSGGTYVFKIWDGAAWRSEAGEFVNVTGDTMTGALGVIAGSASTPGLFFSGDANSGLYSPGADQLALSTNGTGRLFVDASGRVGVGVSSLGDIAAGYATLQIGGTNGGGVRVGTSSAVVGYMAGSASGVEIGTTGTTALNFFTNNQTRATITSAGLVGVGTSTPGFKLTIEDSTTPRIRIGDGVRHLNVDGGSASQNAAIGTDYAGSFGIYTNGAANTRFHMTSAGLVGIGTTSPTYALDVGTTGSTISSSFTSDQSEQYIALKDSGTTLGHVRLGSTSGSMLFFAGNGERGRFDSSGRLLVGTSSARSNVYYTTVATTPSVQFETVGNNYSNGLSLINYSASGYSPVLTLGLSASNTQGTNTALAASFEMGSINFVGNDGTNFRTGASITATNDQASAWGSGDCPTRLGFSTTADGASSPTERLRLNSSGSQQSFSANDVYRAASEQGAGTSFGFYYGYHSATTTQNGTLAYIVYTNGNVINTKNSYAGISDAKLKENIVDATSQWSDIKALQVRKYNFKEGQTHTQIGLIAQEVELVSPGLVTESPDRDAEGNDLGTVTKSVNYSVLYMKAVKALQEAMERIETLEAKVAALESA